MIGFDALEKLETLQLKMEFKRPSEQLLKIGLISISQLKKLKNLNLFFICNRAFDFSFLFFQQMSSVIDLTFGISILTGRRFYPDIKNLPFVFPNLIHFSLGAIKKQDKVDSLVECVENLTKLKTLHLPYSTRRKPLIKEVCKRKGVKFDRSWNSIYFN